MTASTLLGRRLSMPYALLLPLLPLGTLTLFGFWLERPVYRIPEQFPLWAFFFGLPHIVSSFQSMCDGQYLVAYRPRIAPILGIVFLPLLLSAAGVPASLLFAGVLVLTQHHVVAQQFGLSMAVAQMRPTLLLSLCKWSTLTLGVVAAFMTYAATEFDGTAQFAVLTGLASGVSVPLLILILASGALLVWRSRTNCAGAIIFAMNILSFATALFLIFHTRYALAGLMLVRILHDVSGFVVYIGHDTARNKPRRCNLLYRAFPFLPIWLLNLAFAIGLAATLTLCANRMAWIGWVVTGITLAHYYMESFIWRGPTPHRQHFRFTQAPKSVCHARMSQGSSLGSGAPGPGVG